MKRQRYSHAWTSALHQAPSFTNMSWTMLPSPNTSVLSNASCIRWRASINEASPSMVAFSKASREGHWA